MRSGESPSRTFAPLLVAFQVMVRYWVVPKGDVVGCRPKLKEQMEYCMAHPEELTKVAAVQKRVRFFLAVRGRLEWGDEGRESGRQRSGVAGFHERKENLD